MFGIECISKTGKEMYKGTPRWRDHTLKSQIEGKGLQSVLHLKHDFMNVVKNMISVYSFCHCAIIRGKKRAVNERGSKTTVKGDYAF